MIIPVEVFQYVVSDGVYEEKNYLAAQSFDEAVVAINALIAKRNLELKKGERVFLTGVWMLGTDMGRLEHKIDTCLSMKKETIKKFISA